MTKSEWITAARKTMGLSQRQLALMIGVSTGLLSKAENGKTSSKQTANVYNKVFWLIKNL